MTAIMRRIAVPLFLCVAAWPGAHAQRIGWKVTGDTAGAREGCSAREAIMAIDGWFDAFNDADSAGLAATLARPFVFTTGSNWIRGNGGRRFKDTVAAVVKYARYRTGSFDEVITLDSVQFLGWTGARLDFVPYLKRSATDLAGWSIPGIGRGEFWCRLGIKVLNLAPDLSSRPQAEQPAQQPTIRVTYLANAGVMLSSKDEKVIIDGLFRRYANNAVPDEQLQLQLALAQPPYDDVDAILVTHYHVDHVAPEPVISHLRFDPGAMIMSTPQVIDSIRAAMNPRSMDVHRLIARKLKPGTTEHDGVNGVTIYVLAVPHAGAEHRSVEHYAYVVEMAGQRVLHLGDAEISEAVFAPLALYKAGIDLALIPYPALLDDESRRVIAQYIQPGSVIAIHVDPGQTAGRRIEREVSAAFPGATTFYRLHQLRSWSCYKDCGPRQR